MIRSLKIYEFFVTIALKLDDNPLPERPYPGEPARGALNYCLLLQANYPCLPNPD